MQRRILHADKMKAVKELTKFMSLTAEQLTEYGWDWHLSTDRSVTESFEALKEQGRDLPISSKGCDNTVYGSIHINLLNRFWHDVTHIYLNLSFSLEDEYKVIRTQVAVLANHGLSQLAREIFWCDMYGQAAYYNRFGEFVENQDAFVDSCLRHGITTAIIAKH